MTPKPVTDVDSLDLEILDFTSSQEQAVIKLRFGLIDGLPKTLEEIGNMMNLTRERIRQVELSAKKKLKKSRQFSKMQAFLD